MEDNGLHVQNVSVPEPFRIGHPRLYLFEITHEIRNRNDRKFQGQEALYTILHRDRWETTLNSDLHNVRQLPSLRHRVMNYH